MYPNLYRTRGLPRTLSANTENINAALPYMDADMRELAKRALSKVDALTEEEFAELTIYAAEEV